MGSRGCSAKSKLCLAYHWTDRWMERWMDVLICLLACFQAMEGESQTLWMEGMHRRSETEGSAKVNKDQGENPLVLSPATDSRRSGKMA
eukprot:365112-Chlamydomonas_euryale.AAC.1